MEEVLNADGDDAKKMYIDPKKPPTKLERTRAVLGVIIHILREDLRCWISLTTQPSAQLHDRNDLPLVARLIWPQTMIPHINGTCRELINFHVSALVKKTVMLFGSKVQLFCVVFRNLAIQQICCILNRL